MKKISKIILCLMFTFSSLLSTKQISVHAEEEPFLVVDDNEIDLSSPHHFTYSNAIDPDGAMGWSSSPNNRLNASSPMELKTQHWVWTANTAEAIKHNYTFTFVGTGVQLIGIKNDATNNFSLDGAAIETLPISGAANTGIVLYEKKGLAFGTHNVSVTLPQGGSGLQISYAKVFGAPVSTSVKDTITPDMQETPYNAFHYSSYEGKSWTALNSEAYIDLGPNDEKAEQCYYEVPFIGNKIAITASKAPRHGKVKFTVDGSHEQVIDLYNTSRVDTLVYTIANLSEGEHILKAVTMNSKSGSNIINQVVKAEIYHEPYVLNDILVEPSLSFIQGVTSKIEVTASPVYAPLPEISYTSADSNIARVDKDGTIHALNEGSTKITVAANGVASKEITVTVLPQIKAFSGSIVDENLQYTQDTYAKVKAMGTVEKTLNAWQNDQAVSEIAILSKDSSLQNVRVETSDFVNGLNRIDAKHVTATFVKSVQAWTGMQWSGSYPLGNRAESSDILDSQLPIDMEFNQVQPIWIDITIPKDTPAGTYTGSVKVYADGIADALTFTYHVKVANVTLPDAEDFKDGFDVELWQYPYSSAEYYGVEPFSQEHMEILKPIMEKYKSIGGHAITATISEDAWNAQTYSKNAVHYPSMVKWTQQSDGSFTYDFTHFDKWIQFNKDLGIGDKIVLYSIAPWSNSFTYYVDGVLKKEGYQVGNARYTKLWTDFFEAMVVHLDEKGWFEDAFVGIDERGLSEVALDLLDTVTNKDGLKLKTAGAMDGINSNDEHRALARRITDLNVGDTVVQDNKAVFDQLLIDRNEKGLRTTLYSCTGHIPGNFSLSAPAENYWSMMFAYKNGAKGFLRWAYDAWVEDPLRDTTHQFYEAGDCFQIFPDEKDAENPQAKSSVRLEKMAQGVRDVNKLMMMVKEFPELQTDIDALMGTLKTRYESSSYYLSAKGKADIAADMSKLQEGLSDITDKYTTLKGTNVDRTALTALIEETKPNLNQESMYTNASFLVFKVAYEDAQKVMADAQATQIMIDATIAKLQSGKDALVHQYTIIVSKNIDDAGSVSGAGIYADKTTITLVAQPAKGYHFVNWTKDETVLSENASYTFDVVENKTIKANFAKDALINRDILTIQIEAAKPYISQASMYTSTSFAAFKKAYDEALKIIANAQATQIMIDSASVELKNNKDALIRQYTITIMKNIENAGSINGAGDYANNTSITLVAEAAKGYHFVNWTLGDKVLSKEANYTFGVNENRTITANFAEDEIINESKDMIYNEDKSITISGSFDYDVSLVYKQLIDDHLVSILSQIKDKDFTKKYAVLQVFDLSLVKGDVAYLPNGEMLVGIKLDSSFLNKELAIIHIAKDGTTQQMSSYIKDDMIYFKTDHFSIFSIVSVLKLPSLPNDNLLIGGGIKKEDIIKNTGGNDAISDSNFIGMLILSGIISCFVCLKKYRGIR